MAVKKWIFQKCVFGASDLCRGRMVTLLQMECDCLASDTCINSHATINKPLAWQWPCLGKIPNLGSTSVKLCPWAISQSTWSAWQWWTVNSWKKNMVVLMSYFNITSDLALYTSWHTLLWQVCCVSLQTLSLKLLGNSGQESFGCGLQQYSRTTMIPFMD